MEIAPYIGLLSFTAILIAYFTKSYNSRRRIILASFVLVIILLFGFFVYKFLIAQLIIATIGYYGVFMLLFFAARKK